MNMQAAILINSSDREVRGYADREAYEAGEVYVDMQWDNTSRPGKVHRSKLRSFVPTHADKVRAAFTVTQSTHPVGECEKCARYAEAAISSAMVTGSTGATYGEESASNATRHMVTVKRPHPLQDMVDTDEDRAVKAEQERREREAKVVDRVRGELLTGRAFGFVAESNRSADRMNYRHMVPAATYGKVLEVLGRASAMGDLYAHAAHLALAKVSPYLNDWQIKAQVAEAFQQVVVKGWTDTRSATGPEAGRPSSHEHKLSLSQALTLQFILDELSYHLQLGTVPGIGWVSRVIAREEGVKVWATHLPRVAAELAK